MTNIEPVDLVLEYGPDGNVDEGRNAAVYETDNRFVKLSDSITVDEMDEFMQALDSAGINYPETDYYPANIPVYDMGEVMVVEQERAEPGIDYFLQQPEELYLNDIREIGLKAAANGMKLDLGLDNIGFVDGELGVYDINDREALWLDEPLALHLMGSHLLNSITRLEREEDLYTPELKELAHNWKKAV